MGRTTRRGIKGTCRPSTREEFEECIEFGSEARLREYMASEDAKPQEISTQSEQMQGLSVIEEKELKKSYRLWHKQGRSYVRLLGQVFVQVFKSAMGGWRYSWSDNDGTHFSEGSFPNAEECKSAAVSFVSNFGRPSP
jgi:hypothetical protein